MKKIALFLPSFLLLCMGLLSCNKQVDAALQWRMSNEKAFAEYEAKGEYEKRSIEGSHPYVLMKWETRGEGQAHPIETSRLLVHYSVYQIAGNEAQIDSNFDSENPTTIFLSRGSSKDSPIGLSIALQQMVEGDQAVVIIPWHLAYGAERKNNIPAYTALRYIIRLDKIIPETAK